MKQLKCNFNPRDYIYRNYVNNGKINIDININNVNEFYDKFDSKRLTLSKEIVDYIGYKIDKIIYKSDVILTFSLPSITKNEQMDIINIISSYYGLALYQSRRELRFNNFKILILFLLGIIFLAFTHILTAPYILLNDILSIAGWVSIWEMVSIILFDIIKIKQDESNYLRLYNAEIRFVCKNQNTI